MTKNPDPELLDSGPAAKIIFTLTDPNLPAVLPRRLAWCVYCRAPLPAPPPAPQYCDNCLPTKSRDSRADRLKWLKASIPLRYQSAKFGSDEIARRVTPPSAIESAIEARKSKSSVLITGPAGSGKTTLAAAILNSTIARALKSTAQDSEIKQIASSRFVLALELARCVGEHALGHGAPALVHRCEEAALLVIDDLGADPELKNSPVADVIYWRHANNLRTIITSGYSDSQLGARYGEGIFRRISEGVVRINLGAAS